MFIIKSQETQVGEIRRESSGSSRRRRRISSSEFRSRSSWSVRLPGENFRKLSWIAALFFTSLFIYYYLSFIYFFLFYVLCIMWRDRTWEYLRSAADQSNVSVKSSVESPLESRFLSIYCDYLFHLFFLFFYSSFYLIFILFVNVIAFESAFDLQLVAIVTFLSMKNRSRLGAVIRYFYDLIRNFYDQVENGDRGFHTEFRSFPRFPNQQIHFAGRQERQGRGGNNILRIFAIVDKYSQLRVIPNNSVFEAFCL